ncbi:MAG: hypothetical protein Q8875_02940, partial [Pigeon pea little leaf phytoplasma]|nr:hypothetical protein [Pigeon pea little leaf phytoplasma]
KKSCHDAIKRVKQRFLGIDYLVQLHAHATNPRQHYQKGQPGAQASRVNAPNLIIASSTV